MPCVLRSGGAGHWATCLLENSTQETANDTLYRGCLQRNQEILSQILDGQRNDWQFFSSG